MATEKTTDKGAPAGAPKKISAEFSAHLPRLRERLSLLPATDETAEALELLDFLIAHWDQFPDVMRRQQALAASVWIGEIEHRARLDLLLDRGLRRRADNAKGPKNRAKPDWHGECVSYAKSLKATGREGHELGALLAKKYGKDATTVRRLLKKAGVK